ncbi:cytochrome P450 [Talaromyces proteolyticus]|uniref:Cytochrome P450 n=1 Tax=Talaromyces proteolyticus TaxID=1131652 RepID=A0AAD4L4M0_9EURO|nr:cytochrome P450 [Talaromyces proteolyticus]KAH8704941.1 cytochrome P450 [Talaromyces proteolyticus]
MSPSLAKEVLAVQAPVNNHDMVGHFMRNVWDDKGAMGDMDQTILWGKIHRAMYQLNREPFLSQAGKIMTDNIERAVLSLVSSRETGSNLKWQERAHVVVHGPNEYEASFFPLIRHFVADMVLPSLFGTDFIKNYPDIATDLFAFDANFHLFLMGLPPWIPLSGLRESAAARDRVKSAMEDFHNALVAASRGERTTDGRWDNLDDVSSVVKNRVNLWEEAVSELSNKEACIASHAFLLWVTLINANVIVFWLLFHVYQDSSLLAAIREEVSPFVHIRESPGSPERSTITLDSPEIRAQTPLLQSAFLETMRLYTQSNSFKNVQADFVVSESEIDQNIREPNSFVPKGGSKVPVSQSQRTYQLQQGDMICVPFGLHQSDSRYWNHPENFDGRRFIIQQQDSARRTSLSNGRVSVDSTRISPWGSGASICKGQKLSYREVLEIAGAILLCWDIEPAGAAGWSHPGLAKAGGTAIPKRDFRIRLLRRVP